MTFTSYSLLLIDIEFKSFILSRTHSRDGWDEFIECVSSRQIREYFVKDTKAFAKKSDLRNMKSICLSRLVFAKCSSTTDELLLILEKNVRNIPRKINTITLKV